MRTTKKVGVAVAALVGVCVVPASIHSKSIGLADVPRIVVEAAVKAVTGFELLAAERERERGRLVYELNGISSVDGEAYEVEVSAKGKVLEIEKGDDSREGSDDDDHASGDDEDSADAGD